MKVPYDSYYQTENLFGRPYPELLAFYARLEQKGKLLDVGCGQGRDSIPLAKMGFRVTGIDHSSVGINQLNRIAAAENLPLTGLVADIYAYASFDEFEYILLDSMFHFGAKERAQEIAFLDRILTQSKAHALITICIQHVGKKVAILNSLLATKLDLEKLAPIELTYQYEDKASGHRSASKYAMITVQKRPPNVAPAEIS